MATAPGTVTIAVDAVPLALELAQVMLAGELLDRIAGARARGLSYDAVARELAAELELESPSSLSGETIRRWHRHLTAREGT